MKIEVPLDKPTVAKIINAAIPLFSVKGFAAVSVKEVAQAAGVNVALISYYFGGKDNLYEIILKQQFAVLDGKLAEIERDEICPVAKIRILAETLIELHKANPSVDRLFFHEIFNPSQYFKTVVLQGALQMQGFLRSCIEAGKDSGHFRQDIQASFAAIALIKMLNVSFITLLADAEVTAEENLLDVYVSQAVNMGLYGLIKQPFVCLHKRCKEDFPCLLVTP